MKCPNCNRENTDKAKFCNNCGANLSTLISEPKRIQLKCKACNAVMIVDENKQLLVCPYCGSKELIIDSDAVAVQKIKSNTEKDMFYGKLQYEAEKEKRIEEKENLASFKKSKLSKVIIVCAIICAIFCMGGFNNSKFDPKNILTSIISLVQSILFIIAYLMGVQAIKTGRNKDYILVAGIGFILVIPYMILM